jgi:hypothetical protein
MAQSRTQTQVPELLRWGIHNPNPPDPALALILEFGRRCSTASLG